MEYLGDIVSPTFYFTDLEIDYFHKILADYTIFKPQSPLLLQCPDQIKKISHYEHMQVLYHNYPGSRIGHYIAIHFFFGDLHIYDSLNANHLHKDIITYTDRLFGKLSSVKFHPVQQQTNGFDCAPFAIAFITSIILGKYNLLSFLFSY